MRAGLEERSRGRRSSPENEEARRRPRRKVSDGIEQPGGSRATFSRANQRGVRGLFVGINEGRNHGFNRLDLTRRNHRPELPLSGARFGEGVEDDDDRWGRDVRERGRLGWAERALACEEMGSAQKLFLSPFFLFYFLF